MIVSTLYSLGETVFIKCYRGKDPEYLQGEIEKIMVSQGDACNIRYQIRYVYDGEVLYTDRWENDLVGEDLTGFAMPRAYQVVIPEKEEQ